MPSGLPPLLGSLYLLLAVLLAATQGARAQDGIGNETKLPLPRFVSLRSNEVNLRTGPGTTYPVDWVYMRRGLPVEVIAEFDVWRKIRDWQGTVGWVHQSMLDGRRMALVAGTERLLHGDPADKSPAVAKLAAGVIGRLLDCDGAWCRIEVDGYRGWLKRDEFWGTFPDEKIE